MDELTFIDVLAHYQIKLGEISEEIENVKTYIKKAQNSITSGWTSDAATECMLKLDSIYSEMTKTLVEISEAKTNLSAITNIVGEEQSIPFESL